MRGTITALHPTQPTHPRPLHLKPDLTNRRRKFLEELWTQLPHVRKDPFSSIDVKMDKGMPGWRRVMGQCSSSSSSGHLSRNQQTSTAQQQSKRNVMEKCGQTKDCPTNQVSTLTKFNAAVHATVITPKNPKSTNVSPFLNAPFYPTTTN